MACIGWPAVDCVAQNLIDQRELSRYGRKIESYRNQYQRTARRDPSNEGAKTLVVRLDSVRVALEGFSKERSPKQHVLDAVQAAVSEATRYSTPQAQKTVQLLAELANFLKTQPDLDYLIRSDTQATPASRSPQNVRRPSTQVSESQSPKSNADTQPHPQLEAASSNSMTEQGDIVSEESLTWDVILYWFILGVLAVSIILLYRKMALLKVHMTEQHKSLQQQLMSLDFKQAGQAASAGSGEFLDVVRKDFNKRMDRMEQNTAEFIQLLETRLQNIEQSSRLLGGATSSGPADLPDFILQSLEHRISELEKRIPIPSATHEPVPILASLPAPAHLEAIFEALAQIRRQSNLKPLTDRAQWLSDQLKRAEHQQQPELVDLHLASEVIQLAYVAAYNEQLDDPYLALVRAFEPLGLVPDSARPGDPHLPADVAANVSLAHYRQESRFLGEELPNRPTVLRQIEKRWSVGQPPAGVLAQVLKPSIWFQAQQQPRVLLVKGQYVVG